MSHLQTILIIPFLLCVLMPACAESIFAQRCIPSDDSNNRDVRAAFAKFEGSKINVYSSSLDGKDSRLILSEETDLNGARPFAAIRAEISPKGDRLVYTIPSKLGNTPIYIVNGDGSEKRKILDKAEHFKWLPNGKEILFSIQPLSALDDFAGQGQPLWTVGAHWFILNLATGLTKKVAGSRNHFHGVRLWAREKEAVFQTSSLFDTWLHRYDVRSKKKLKSSKVLGFGPQLADLTSNQKGTRTVGSVLPQGYAVQNSCNLYSLTKQLTLGRRLVASPEYHCQNLFWNGNDQIFYNKGTGPFGRIRMTEASESGHYILMSVYRFDFKSHKETPVLLSSGKEVYRLQQVLSNRAIVVSNEAQSRLPKHILEVRDIDGQNPVELSSSDREMWLIGWLRPPQN